MYSDADGESAVRIARQVVDQFTTKRKRPVIEDYPITFQQNSGAFTTLSTYPENELRGCIGLPLPRQKLIDALIESAMSATQDPRFPPLAPGELDRIVVEVTIMSPLEVIKARVPKDYISQIQIGRDGLYLESSWYSGLLLPQVPVEYGWDVEEYLAHLSMKAGMAADGWARDGVRISRFSGEVFHESEPRGKVVREALVR
jgi:uncharacterized protein (TIGR00296 family)